jgi:hypothetical protein
MRDMTAPASGMENAKDARKMEYGIPPCDELNPNVCSRGARITDHE